jgi:hypothetical protein
MTVKNPPVSKTKTGRAEKPSSEIEVEPTSKIDDFNNHEEPSKEPAVLLQDQPD